MSDGDAPTARSAALSAARDGAVVASTWGLRHALAEALLRVASSDAAADVALGQLHGWLLSEDAVAVVAGALERAARERPPLDRSDALNAGYVLAALARCLAWRPPPADAPGAASTGSVTALVDVILPGGPHRYWSTHCRHGDHEACAATQVAPGVPRRPAQCKTCGAPCQCPHPDCAHRP